MLGSLLCLSFKAEVLVVCAVPCSHYAPILKNEMARVPALVPKLQDLKHRLHHVQTYNNSVYKGLNLDHQAMLAIRSLRLLIRDFWVLGLGSSYIVFML